MPLLCVGHQPHADSSEPLRRSQRVSCDAEHLGVIDSNIADKNTLVTEEQRTERSGTDKRGL